MNKLEEELEDSEADENDKVGTLEDLPKKHKFYELENKDDITEKKGNYLTSNSVLHSSLQ